MSVAVAFDSVTKQYRGAGGDGHWRYRSLRDDLQLAAKRLAGLSARRRSVIDAVSRLSFEIAEGETVAIMGPNGAGKTTALKLMSRVAYPTTGAIRVRGRVGALLEVGTGLHPELTGRENVSLYGRILGLSGRDVAARFDEIVEFAELQAAIDQPVKQYSSGMVLRLGFSLAAHLEPDILLVDEALAVGDAAFHYRCVERMRELVRGGRTLVLVSHDLSAVETLCERAILLRKGVLERDGPVREVIRDYLESVWSDQVARGVTTRSAGAALKIVGVDVRDAAGAPANIVLPGEPLTVRLHVEAPAPVAGPIFTVGIGTAQSGLLALASMLVDGEAPARIEGRGTIECTFERLPLNPGVYEVWGGARGEAGYGELLEWQRLAVFRVGADGSGDGRAVVSAASTAPLKLAYRWGAAPAPPTGGEAA